jgi:hypothetical protein
VIKGETALKRLVAKTVGFTLACALAVPVASRADDKESLKPWTSVGSTGTLSAVDLDKVVMSGPLLSFASNASGTVVARYNVVANDALFSELGERPGIGLNVLYRDLGPGSSIAVTLFRSSLINSGGTIAVLSFNSEAFPQTTSTQWNGVSMCGHQFDFAHNAYHIEVTMTRTAGAPSPFLRALQVAAVPCID